jgi:hypothetical protein
MVLAPRAIGVDQPGKRSLVPAPEVVKQRRAHEAEM